MRHHIDLAAWDWLPKVLPALHQAGVIAPLSARQLSQIVGAVGWLGRSIATLSAIAAIRYPHQVAIYDDAGQISYQQLHQRAMRIAGGLALKYGVTHGQTVGILCRNHRDFFAALIACTRLGVDVVLLNTDFPAPQLAQVLARHTFALMIHDDEFAAVIAQAGFRGATVWAGTQPPSTASSLDQLAHDYRAPSMPNRHTGQLILLTSGTSGTPRGAPRTPNAWAFLGPLTSIFQHLPIRSGQAMYVAPPVFHGFGLATALLGWVIGAPIILTRRFKPELALYVMQQHHAKIAFMVPIMLQRILSLPEAQLALADLSGVDAVLSGAAPLSHDVAQRWMQRFGRHLFNGYGSSETGLGTLATPEDLCAAPSTIGRAFYGTQIKIMNDQGIEQATGVVGHVCVKSQMTFEGYVGGGHKTQFAGYMNTGDLGHQDAAGRLFIDGREDDMIVSGGENVFPQEVADVLMQHPQITDAAVYGVADPEFGQRLVAFVVADLPEAEVFAYLKTQIARYKIPREVVFVDELPRNPSGKVLKRSLLARLTPVI